MPNWSDEIQTGLAQLEADCEAQKARIAELEQRIKNVVRFVSDTSYLSSNKINRIIAIAEGRDNG